MKTTKKLDERTLNVLKRIQRDLQERVGTATQAAIDARNAIKVAQGEAEEAVVAVLAVHGFKPEDYKTLEFNENAGTIVWGPEDKIPEQTGKALANKVMKLPRKKG